MRAALLAVIVLAVVLVAACGETEPAVRPTERSAATAPPTTVAPAGSSEHLGSDDPTSDPAPPVRPLLEAACDGNLRVRVAGTLPEELTSVSGLVTSRRHDGIVWAIEDSFEPPVLTALDLHGSVIAQVRVHGGPAMNLDWEDVAVATGPDGTPWIHVADIGDDLGVRREVRVHRFPEPGLGDQAVRAQTDTMSYVDGERPDAEGLVVDGDGRTWVLDTHRDRRSRVFRLDDDGVLRAQGEVALDDPVTAADLSEDGSVLALRTRRGVHLFEVPSGATLDEVLAGPSCAAPEPPERQGESIAILPGGGGLVTVSEDEAGIPVDLHLTAR